MKSLKLPLEIPKSSVISFCRIEKPLDFSNLYLFLIVANGWSPAASLIVLALGYSFLNQSDSNISGSKPDPAPVKEIFEA